MLSVLYMLTFLCVYHEFFSICAFLPGYVILCDFEYPVCTVKLYLNMIYNLPNFPNRRKFIERKTCILYLLFYNYYVDKDVLFITFNI